MMKDGVKRYVKTGVTTAIGTVRVLVASGMQLEHALQAAEVLTLDSMDRQIDRALAEKPAPTITEHLAHLDDPMPKPVTPNRKRTPEKT